MKTATIKAAVFDIRGYAVPPPKNPDDWKNWFGDRGIRIFSMQEAVPPARAVVEIFESLTALLACLEVGGISPQETVYFSNDVTTLMAAADAKIITVFIPSARINGQENYLWNHYNFLGNPDFFSIAGAINFLSCHLSPLEHCDTPKTSSDK